VLLFDLAPTPPGPGGLAKLGRKWGVSGARDLCREVAQAVMDFAPVAERYAVPAEEIRRFSRDIERRLRRP
jgi:hypothetical protein